MRRVFGFLIYPLLVMSVYAQTNYYISPQGNDNNHGTSTSKAWQTLTKLSSQTFAAGDSIFFERNGIYRGTFYIKGSGNSSLPIFVGSYGNGKEPVISGAEVLQNANWQIEFVGGIKTYKTNFADIARFVFVDRKFHHLARYPDNHYLFVDNAISSGNFTMCGKSYPRDSVIVSDSLTTIAMNDITGAYINLRTSGWNIATFKAIAFDKAKGKLSLHSSSYGWSTNLTIHNSSSEKYGFFLSNKKEFLSQQSEFWVDEANQLLYLVANTIPSFVEYSKHNYGIKLTDTMAHDIKIKEIEFNYQSISSIELKENDNRIYIIDCKFQHTPFGVHNRGESRNTDCFIRRALTYELEIKGNKFSDIYRSAVACFPSHSVITNNYIIRNAVLPNIGEWLNLPRSYDVIDFANGSAIQTGNHCIVEHNIIDSTGHYGILPAYNSFVNKNIVNNSCLNYYDCGALYSVFNDSITIKNNFVNNCYGNFDKGVFIPSINSLALIAGNGVYIDYNGDLRYTSVEVEGNTITNCGRGIGFITSDDFIGKPNKYGNGYCSPPSIIKKNVLYNNHYEEFGIGAQGIPDANHIPKTFLYSPLQFTDNSVVHFDEDGFALRTSNKVSDGVNWGKYNNNFYVSLNNKYIATKSYLAGLISKNEWVEPYEWQLWGQDSASYFVFPMQSNIFVFGTLPQGNLIRNSKFNSNYNFWNFYATNKLCLNNINIDSTSYFSSNHLYYYNPSGLCGVNNNISISTNLADSTNAFSASVNIDSSINYSLSFDVYSSIPVDAKNLANTFWSVSLTNTQNNELLFNRTIEPRDTLQHFKFIFKPKTNALQANLKFFSYHIQGNLSFRLDNVSLIPLQANKWSNEFKFPLISNMSDSAKTYIFDANCFLYLDSTPVISPLSLKPWSSVVLIRIDTCKLMLKKDTVINAIVPLIKDKKNSLEVFPNPTNNDIKVIIGNNIVGEELLIFNIQGKKVISFLTSNSVFKLSVSDLPSGMYYLKIGNATKRLIVQ
ncbi:MAG: T9SS type A sorting domain-containing protein [Bacteroidetes bacterium]|nr:T9SS type A sorting domain-containing protein [Bacteroidota bacterium]